MKETLKKAIKKEIRDRLRKDFSDVEEFDSDEVIKKLQLQTIVDPIVEEAVFPLIDQIEELNKAINQINSALPPAFTSIGAGTAAVGANGAATYSSTQSKVAKSSTEIQNKLKDLRSD